MLPVREERIGVSLVSASDLLRQQLRRRASSRQGTPDDPRPGLLKLRVCFVRRLWIPHPRGVEPIDLVRRLDRALREATVPACWQPLPAPACCPKSAVEFPAGAIVLTGSREGIADRTSIYQILRWGFVLGLPVLSVIAAVLIDRPSALASTCVLPFYLVPISLLATGAIVRVLEARDAARHDRFGPGDVTWSIEPGMLRIVQRGTSAPQRTIPSSAIDDLRATARLDPTGRFPQVRIVAVAAESLYETDIIVPLPLGLDAREIEGRLLGHLRSA
ncbi:MAG: hypothetical protein U0625_05530 [Phycisphaerales bacterium]